MDPSRTPLSPAGLKRRRASPSTEHLSMVPPGQQSQQQQTSLPSIRQLHPYLPPSSSGISQSLSPELSGYSYAPQYSPQIPQVDAPSHTTGASQRDPAIYGIGESEADDLEQQNPPKKKRRRQALSCTECKRRKIKCDRTQPCTPCARRGEEAGCQWHIVEPIEKYVTKAEFDHLKSRYEQLEAFVRRYLPVAPSIPYYPMGVQSGMQGIVNEAVQPYPSGPSSMVYPSAMMPQPSSQPLYQQPHAEASTTAAGRYMRPEASTQSPTRQHAPMALVGTSASPVMSTALQASVGSMKTSPLSLASITSPYHPDQPQIASQSKNYHAQTFIPGERLRPGSEDPTNFTGKTQRAASVGLTLPAMGRQGCREPWRQLPTPSNQGIKHHHELVI